MTSLDSFLEEGLLLPVSFIKADVDGFRRELLHGAEETSAATVPGWPFVPCRLPDDWHVI